MRSSRAAAEHQAAVSRRLALLSAELAGERRPARGEEPRGPRDGPGEREGHAEDDPREGLLVPLPGRHAARRSRQLLAALVPPTLRGRVALGPGQVAAVAVVVALGLAATCWWVVRGDPEPVAPGTPVPGAVTAGSLVALPSGGPPGATGPAAPGDPVATGGGTGTGQVTVDVAGEVRRPGIVVLPGGSRVVDALEAAGGARRGVDLTPLNLARLLVDGEQVVVGGPPGAPVVAGPGQAPSGVPGVLLDLNTATEADLDTLPEVGPVTAQAIVAWREAHGGFSSVDELLEVDGIGEATLARIAPLVTVA